MTKFRKILNKLREFFTWFKINSKKQLLHYLATFH